MTKTAETAPESPVAQAHRQRDEAVAAAETAKRTQDELERRLDEHQKQIQDARQRAIDAASKVQMAQEQAERVEREALAAEPVTLNEARSIAEGVLQLFEDTRQHDDRESARREFWRKVDRIRCRLATNDIAEECRSLVLAIEATIGFCDFYEALKDTKSLGGGYDAAHGSLPTDDRRMERYETELQRELENRPPKAIETLGQLVSQLVDQQLSPDQLSLMLQMRGGAQDARLIGGAIDEAFSRAGIDSRCQPLAVKQYGAADLQHAWAKRERRITTGEVDALVSGIDQMPGERRRGRGF